MSLKSKPASEVDIDLELVRGLLSDQHPDLAEARLELIDEGWDCVLVRTGEDQAARLPRRKIAVPLVEHELRWLTMLAPQLPVPVPAPTRRGEPGRGYPWPWTVVPWFEGTTVERTPLGAEACEALAAFLTALHVRPPEDAPTNDWRGVPLSTRADSVEGWMADLEARPDDYPPEFASKIRAVWSKALDSPMDVSPTWIHGDLHPRNVISKDGELAAVVDWGDMCAGDRANDLAALWMLLPTMESRARAMELLAEQHNSEYTWARARGWVIFFGTIMLHSGLAGDPAFAASGRTILERVLEGP